MKKIYSIICAFAVLFASSGLTKAYAAETCTLSGEFWMQHLQVWPDPFTPDSEICGLTFSEIIQTPSEGTPWYILAHEWIPAQLNIANGAVSTCIQEQFDEATALLEDCNFSQNPDAISDYFVLAGALADYNSGILIGCPGCPEGTIVIAPPCVCPQCPACPDCCCPPCPPARDCICKVVVDDSHRHHRSSRSSRSSSSHKSKHHHGKKKNTHHKKKHLKPR